MASKKEQDFQRKLIAHLAAKVAKEGPQSFSAVLLANAIAVSKNPAHRFNRDILKCAS